MSLSIIEFFLLTGAVQGFFLTFVLIARKREDPVPNRLLAVLIIILSASSAVYVWGSAINQREELGMYLAVLLFLIGPVLFYYCHFTINGNSKFKKGDIIHFLPALFFTILMIAWNLVYGSVFHSFIHPLISTSIAIQTIPYLVKILLELRSYSRRLKKTQSSIEKQTFKWLAAIVLIYFSIWILVGLFELFNHFLNWVWEFWGGIWTFSTLCLYIIGYFSLAQPELSPITMSLSAENSPGAKKKSESEKTKYGKSALTPTLAVEFKTRLIKYMESKKPYLQQGLTLSDLAKGINITPHNLSQILNEQFSLTFFDYINGLRVDEAANMLSSPEGRQLLIVSIAFDAGFSSLSSFNAAFKKKKGVTPSQFRKLCETPK
ncbi:MAG: helix-turn-helix transcriptional regulator [Spirochaetaceae bacterium]|nr:helix-turn-helix transcriptional regulator [Spirochaetaceae bacterium]